MASRWRVACWGGLGVVLAATVASVAGGCSSDDEEAVPPASTTTSSPSTSNGGAGGGGSPPVTDIELPALSAPVRVSVDGQGVKHLTCATDADCLTAYGYVQSQDLFMWLDIMRRGGRGRWAELSPSPGNLEYDRSQRHFMSTPDGTPLEEAIWEKLSAETRELVEAYTAGVNAWIADLQADRNGARVSEEYDQGFAGLADKLVPWEPLDVIAIAASSEQGETGTGLTPDVGYADALVALGPELFRDIVLTPPASPVSIVPPALQGRAPSGGFGPGSAGGLDLKPQLDALAQARARLAPQAGLVGQLHEAMERHAAVRDRMGQPHASNNWAVAGSRTANGAALVESDPHGQLYFPTHMYLIGLDSKTEGTGSLHAMGVGLASPVFYIGRNEHLAWGLTTSMADLLDYYEETLVDNGTAVLFEGQSVPLVEKTITIHLPDGNSTEETLQWVPHHGPLIARDGAQGLSVRWVGHSANAHLDYWFEIMRASSAAEGLDAARKFEARGNNLVMGDTAGHVAWRPLIRMPHRPWAAQYPPYLPLPGDGSAEWEGYLAADQHLELYDPPQGFVTTSNNDFTGAWYDGDPTNDATPYMQWGSAVGSRAERITAQLGAASDHDGASMLALQSDAFLWMASELVPELLALAAAANASLSVEGQAAYDALQGWPFVCPTGLSDIAPDAPDHSDATLGAAAVGCSVYHALMGALSAALVVDDCQAIGVTCDPETLRVKLLHAIVKRPAVLATGQALWDDAQTPEVETAGDIVVRALDEAGSHLTSLRGADTNEWRWGRVTSLVLQPIVGTGAPYLMQGPYAVSGGYISVNPVIPRPTANGYRHDYGAMLRMVVDFGASGPVDFWQLPGGIEHHTDSPYYAHLLEDYVRQHPFHPPFEAADVAEQATEIIVLGPGS